jgi:hypothetical protein
MVFLSNIPFFVVVRSRADARPRTVWIQLGFAAEAGTDAGHREKV